jgi:hypothetical protein
VTVNASCTTLFDTFAVTGTSNVTYDERVTTVYVRFADAYGNWGPPEPFQVAASQTGGNLGHPSLEDLPYNGYVQFWSWPYARAQTAAAWSGLPQAPNIIAPRHSGLTLTPVVPSARTVSRSSSVREKQARGLGHGSCHDPEPTHPRNWPYIDQAAVAAGANTWLVGGLAGARGVG